MREGLHLKCLLAPNCKVWWVGQTTPTKHVVIGGCGKPRLPADRWAGLAFLQEQQVQQASVLLVQGGGT